MKYYAVRKGIKVGIFTDWDSCKEATKGYSGAEFKSFGTQAEAEQYLAGIDNVSTVMKPTNANEVLVYVDGSFQNEVIAFGIYIESANKDFKFCGCVDSFQYNSLRNVAGELFGALCGVELAKDMGFKKVSIIYDYQGLESWYTGEWKAKTSLGIKYTSILRGLHTNDDLDINFIKVKGHSGNYGNNIADKLAKRAGVMKNYVDTDLIFKGTLSVNDISFVNCF